MADRPGFRIGIIHAIVGVDDDNEEAIPAITVDGVPFPLIASDRIRLELITGMAQILSNQIGKNFKIVRFSVREDIGEVISDKNKSAGPRLN